MMIAYVKELIPELPSESIFIAFVDVVFMRLISPAGMLAIRTCWKAAEEFDYTPRGPAYAASIEYIKKCEEMRLPPTSQARQHGFNDGARWQHSQDQLVIQKWKEEADLWRKQSANWKAEVQRLKEKHEANLRGRA